jgi:hypothetical protein
MRSACRVPGVTLNRAAVDARFLCKRVFGAYVFSGIGLGFSASACIAGSSKSGR